MAILVTFSVSGMTSATYESIHRRLEAVGAGAPAGRLHHVSYGSPDNLQVVDLFDSPESFAAFGNTLVPILQKMGVVATPHVEPVYRVIPG
jgi:hypothetical protein